ncbi:MAG: AAA family ATPase [Rhodoferax sp.]|nr:AAA family ATPase [Rhodoferax sp.]
MSHLYLDHFGLTKPPFKITPDLDFFFSGGRRGDILSALLHVAQHEEGIITVVAEVGSGKTLLSRLMLSQLGPQVNTVYLANPCFSRDEILSAIARDLGISDLPTSTEAKLSVLQQELLRRHAEGVRVLVVVDEAHAMPPESLEEVRLLSNLETASHKLINIMLFGQPELDTLLRDPRLRQVRDRVIHRFELQPLPAAEARAYVDHRLRAAGWKGGALFSPAALNLLVKASGGRARRINLLADKALLGAYAQGAQTVDLSHVKGALGELHDEAPVASPAKWAAPLKWGLASIALAGLMTVVALRFLAPAPAPVVVAAAAPAAVTAPVVVPVPAQTSPLAAQASAPKPLAPGRAPTVAASADTLTVDASLQTYLNRTKSVLGVAEPPAGYTIQLASLPRDASVAGYLNFVGHHVDSSMVYAQLSTYNGRNFASVFYGNFANPAQANTALLGLPLALKSNKPIVRTWVKIKQDQVP